MHLVSVDLSIFAYIGRNNNKWLPIFFYGSWDDHESNLPITLVRFLNGQAKEIARKCVEAPLLLDRTKETFRAQPSFQRTLRFLIEATIDFHIEVCPICQQKCLPTSAECIDTNDNADNYIERVYCGHIYHQGCLKRYMREPPFPAGGKVCPARKIHPRSDKVSKYTIHLCGK